MNELELYRKLKRAEEEFSVLKKQFTLAMEALNKLAVAQSGSLDYTAEFNELVKSTVRGVLEEIEGRSNIW